MYRKAAQIVCNVKKEKEEEEEEEGINNNKVEKGGERKLRGAGT